MASYTIELRKVCELYGRNTVENWFKDYNIEDYLTSKQIETIENANIWSKEKLAKKIVDHYYMREIGFETPALFEHYVKITMKEIMEEKLPLIYTNSIEYDPLINVDFTETFKRKSNEIGENNGTIEQELQNQGTSNSNSSNEGNTLNIINNTPQTNITKQNLQTGVYASQVNQNDTTSNIEDTTTTENQASSTQNNSLNSSIENTEEYTKNFKGNQGISATYQAMIKQFRENIVTIDKDIIENLNTLFMGIY